MLLLLLLLLCSNFSPSYNNNITITLRFLIAHAPMTRAYSAARLNYREQDVFQWAVLREERLGIPLC